MRLPLLPGLQRHVVRPALGRQQLIEPRVMGEAAGNARPLYGLHHPEEGLENRRFLRGQMDGFWDIWDILNGYRVGVSLNKNLSTIPRFSGDQAPPAFWSTSAAPPSPPVSLVGTQCSSKPVG